MTAKDGRSIVLLTPAYGMLSDIVLAVLQAAACEKVSVTISDIVTSVFLADCDQLNLIGRPISCDVYEARMHGPVGRTLHALLMGDPATVARTRGVKWKVAFLPGASDVDGTCEIHSPDGEPDTAAVLSPSDVAALATALRFVKEADASTLRRRLQGHPAYVDATAR